MSQVGCSSGSSSSSQLVKSDQVLMRDGWVDAGQRLAALYLIRIQNKLVCVCFFSLSLSLH